MLTAYKIRLYPNKVQRQAIKKACIASKQAYNIGLGAMIAFYDEHKKTMPQSDVYRSVSAIRNADVLPEDSQHYAVLAQVRSSIIGYALLNLKAAYANFFRTKKGFPKFKNRNSRLSAKNDVRNGAFVDFENSRVSLDNTTKGIKAVIHREIEGKVKSLTFSITKSGKYYCSVLVEQADRFVPKPDVTKETSVGVDMGIKNVAVLSDGTYYDSPKPLAKSLKNLQRQSRAFSRKVKGSKNFYKQKHRLAVVHEKVANQRLDFAQKLTTELVSKFDTVCIEDLNVKGMVRNKRLARHLSDVSLGQLKELIERKCERDSKNFVKVGRFYASSKTCSSCGHVHQTLTLSERTWECENCKTVHCRDFNASQNILNEGLRLLQGEA